MSDMWTYEIWELVEPNKLGACIMSARSSTPQRLEGVVRRSFNLLDSPPSVSNATHILRHEIELDDGELRTDFEFESIYADPVLSNLSAEAAFERLRGLGSKASDGTDDVVGAF